MIKYFEQFVKIVITVLCITILCIGFYNLFVNIFHKNYIDQKIRVSELDHDYYVYKQNLEKIKSNLKIIKKNKEDKLYNGINTCLNYLKKDETVYGIKTGEYLKPYDIYRLNADFSNILYNYCWVNGLGFPNIKKYNYNESSEKLLISYDQSVQLLIENSNYIKKEMLGNSSYHYRTNASKHTVRNDLDEQYNMVLSNYRVFSDIVVEISDLVAKGDY